MFQARSELGRGRNAIVQREYFDHCPGLSQTVRDNLRQRAFLELLPVLRAVFEAAEVNDHAQHFYPLSFSNQWRILSIFEHLHIFHEFSFIRHILILSARHRERDERHFDSFIRRRARFSLFYKHVKRDFLVSNG